VLPGIRVLKYETAPKTTICRTKNNLVVFMPYLTWPIDIRQIPGMRIPLSRGVVIDRSDNLVYMRQGQSASLLEDKLLIVDSPRQHNNKAYFTKKGKWEN
jgi:hypothetical protein